VLRQLEREGKYEERRALLKSIKDTDPELAEKQVDLMDNVVLLSSIVISIVICIGAKRVLENYFK
jgi:hypothetical protein